MTTELAHRDDTVTVRPAYAIGALVALAFVYSATTTLKLSAAAAGALYWALNALSWAALAASVVASFGIATTFAGLIYGYAKKWAFKRFVAW